MSPIHESHMSYDCHTPLMMPWGEVDFGSFPGEVWSISADPDRPYIGYDDWISHFHREQELDLIIRALHEVRTHGKRIHIQGISTTESLDILREYYAECGYEDILAKSYILPLDTLFTVSISLSHALWCAKDKMFLNKKNNPEKPRGHIIPPLRGPSDLRSIQQGIRMGIIMGIEVNTHESIWCEEVIRREICPIYQLAQMTYYRWIKYGFTGEQRSIQMQI